MLSFFHGAGVQGPIRFLYTDAIAAFSYMSKKYSALLATPAVFTPFVSPQTTIKDQTHQDPGNADDKKQHSRP